VLLERYDGDAPINLGTGVDVTIGDLARIIASTVGFTGELAFDPTKPDGTPRKVLDVSRQTALGFRPVIGLSAGIRSTYDWYRETTLAAAARVPAPVDC
jgi:GDP-L-fucose synthase